MEKQSWEMPQVLYLYILTLKNENDAHAYSEYLDDDKYPYDDGDEILSHFQILVMMMNMRVKILTKER